MSTLHEYEALKLRDFCWQIQLPNDKYCSAELLIILADSEMSYDGAEQLRGRSFHKPVAEPEWKAQ